MKDFSRCNLAGRSFRHADLPGADFSRSNCAHADFTGADLRGADFSRSNLAHAILTDADITGADFSRANLAGAAMPIGQRKAEAPPPEAPAYGQGAVRPNWKIGDIFSKRREAHR